MEEGGSGEAGAGSEAPCVSFVSANGRGHSRCFHFMEIETEAWQGGGLPELRTVVVDKDMNSELNDFPFEDR